MSSEHDTTSLNCLLVFASHLSVRVVFLLLLRECYISSFSFAAVLVKGGDFVVSLLSFFGAV